VRTAFAQASRSVRQDVDDLVLLGRYRVHLGWIDATAGVTRTTEKPASRIWPMAAYGQSARPPGSGKRGKQRRLDPKVAFVSRYVDAQAKPAIMAALDTPPVRFG
jgi:hypothetical protein